VEERVAQKKQLLNNMRGTYPSWGSQQGGLGRGLSREDEQTSSGSGSEDSE
jgi:hypothetical protein